MGLLSDLLVAQGVDPARLEKSKRFEICHKHGPQLLEHYVCSEEVCTELWGKDIAYIHWSKGSEKGKKDIKEVFLQGSRTLLGAVLGRNKR